MCNKNVEDSRGALSTERRYESADSKSEDVKFAPVLQR